MMQLKAIFSELLRNFEFELVDSPDSYQNDHSKMVVQLEQPCRIRYRRRSAQQVKVERETIVKDIDQGAFQIAVDLDFCQGHQVCISEAPEVFSIERVDGADKVVLRSETPDSELRSKVELAVKHCPTRAIRIERPTSQSDRS